MAFVFEQDRFPKVLQAQSDFMIGHQELIIKKKDIGLQSDQKFKESVNKIKNNIESNIKLKQQAAQEELQKGDKVHEILKQIKKQYSQERPIKIQKDQEKNQQRVQNEFQKFLNQKEKFDQQIQEQNKKIEQRFQSKQKDHKKLLQMQNQNENKIQNETKEEQSQFLMKQLLENPDFYNYDQGKIGHEKSKGILQWKKELQTQDQIQKEKQKQKQEKKIFIQQQNLLKQDKKEIAIQELRNLKQSSFFRSASQRDHFLYQQRINVKNELDPINEEYLVDATPGPGHYYQASVSVLKEQKRQQQNKDNKNMNFVFKQDWFQNYKQNTSIQIGPGQYNLKSQFGKENQVPLKSLKIIKDKIKFQNINIKRDFLFESKEDNQDNQWKNIIQDQCTFIKKSFNKQQNIFSKSQWFQQENNQEEVTSNKNELENLQDTNQQQNNIQQQIKEQTLQRNSTKTKPFNSTQPRMNQDHNQSTPGPCQYSQQNSTIKNELQFKLSKNFSSNKAPQIKTLQYNQAINKQANNQQQIQKLVQQQQIQNKIKNTHKQKQKITQSFLSTQQRFQEDKLQFNTHIIYDTSVNWIGKSFNVKF